MGSLWPHHGPTLARLKEGNVLFANGRVQAGGMGASARATWKVQVILLLSHWD